MSGVACATPVTPSHRRPVLAPDCLWENGCHGPTVRRDRKSFGVRRPKTPLWPAVTKKPGVIRGKFRSVDPAISSPPLGRWGWERG